MATTDEALAYHLPDREARRRFDQTGSEVKAARMQGAFGTTQEEQATGIQEYYKKAYPQLFPGNFDPPGGGMNTPERDAYVTQYKEQHPGPTIDNLPQFLADRGILQQPKSAMQELGYPLVQAGLETGLTMGGAALGGAPGMVAGSLLSQVVDMGTRYSFGLPQKTWAQTGIDTGLSVGGNLLTDAIVAPMSKWLGRFNKNHILYGEWDAYNPITPGEQSQLDVLGQGSKLAGTYGTSHEAFPSPSAFVEGSQGQRLRNTRTWFNDVSNVSLGGGFTADVRSRDYQIAKDAFATDMIRQVGEDGALSDASAASRLIHDMTANRFQVSREIKRGVYDSAGNLPGANAPIDTGNLYQTFAAMSSRLDVGSVVASTENRFAFTDSDLMSHLVNAQGQQSSNYRQLAELRSTLLYLQRAKNAAAVGSANSGMLQAEGRTAGYLAGEVTKTLETAAATGQIPRRTLTAFQYADKLAREEAETFTRPMILKIVDKFRDQPETFARELLKEDNADVLVEIQKAITSTPDVVQHFSAQTPQSFFDAELQRPSLYRRAVRASGKDVWEESIQPQLQAELFRNSLEAQKGQAFEKALDYGASPAYGQAKQAFAAGNTTALRPEPDDFVRFNPKSLITKLEALSENTREAIFGTQQGYNRALTAAKAMDNYEIKQQAGIGSFLVLSKQSAALTDFARVIGGGVNISAALGAGGYVDTKTDNHLLAGVAAMSIFVAPAVWAKMVNNPQTFKAFILAMKQTPGNAMKARVITQLTQNSIREVAQESERAYPVLPGESH